MTVPGRLVFVTVGTDHHRFDRLVDWVDAWSPPEEVEVRVVVQYGTSHPPRHHEGASYLPGDELCDLVAHADVVVTQGGPGGIMDARRAGLLPIVVPRSADLGEHVDNHQLAFAAHLARSGEVLQATSREDLHRHLTLGVTDPGQLRIVPVTVAPTAAVDAFGQAVSQLMTLPRHGLTDRLPWMGARPSQASHPRLRPRS